MQLSHREQSVGTVSPKYREAAFRFYESFDTENPTVLDHNYEAHFKRDLKKNYSLSPRLTILRLFQNQPTMPED